MMPKIPPALVALFFAAFMYLLDRLLPVGEFDFFGREWLITALGITAVGISLTALVQFLKKRTTLNSAQPSKTGTLVTNGVYAYTRNPMYLSMLLLLLAWGLWLGNAFNTLLAALFVAFMNRFQIKAEEESLKRLFGKDYKAYCIQVRRWF